MTSSLSPEVLIVGAGPTGLVLAHELSRRGISLRIIDKNQKPAQQSRALVIQVRSLEIFHFMGVLNEMLQKGQDIEHINLFLKGRLSFQTQFKGLNSPYPFPLVLPQNDTETILIKALEKQGILIERNTELIDFTQDSNGVDISLLKETQTEKIRTAYLVGCDGAHSTVRHGLKFPFLGAAYPQTFSLADVELESCLKTNELSIFFDKQGFFAVFPMRQGWVRLITARSSPNTGTESSPTLADFQKYVDHFIPGKGIITKTYWLTNFHLHHRGVSSYQKGRVLIAGDAAHIHSPAGGQGMNTGIQDSFNLGWKLAWVILNKAKPNILNTYSEERQPVGARVLKTSDRFFKAVASQSILARGFRVYILPFLAKFILPSIARNISFFVSQLQVNYRKCRGVAEAPQQSWPKQAPQPGERAPDGFCGNQKLFDLFKSTKYILLLFSQLEDSKSILVKLEELQNKFDGILEIYQADHKLGTLYGIQESGIYLIRPDRYVGFRQQGLDLANLENYLAGNFFFK